MNKVILVVLDGLNAKTAHTYMGFLEHLIENNQCAAYRMNAELPAQSRPLYEVIQTGVPSYLNGIVSNGTVRRSKETSVFQLAKAAGLKTGAASYHWVSELYNKAPFNPMTDRIQLDTDQAIENGLFYYEDHYPDSHLIADGAYLINEKQTDYILIHSMNIDDIGHKFGSQSKEYVQAAVRMDALLANYLMDWLKKGYQVVVTADHGMNEYCTHNGVTEEERQVPLYIFSDKVTVGDCRETLVPQLQLAPLLCYLLAIEKSAAMQDLTFI
ncbi:Type I phosphodiesterase / nucleotide pyrophosphatase [Carnobacterium iners]|uniref:Type I phosphodiesterase / nucleotide pyrophosphatase n=1 Tax=Carnobacterium iners TaxID=1073423 RepID=A0A1X7N8V0_9LACT|nr:alkaline phosphatase family protein [Carnobacterium iners]SEL07946.1 Type I phosphodiesterase / nucleotide pyrophosphatase [Carnobacterium iners]SMH34006.1 Type I phosphodiesterase / nucleotide pyrophosphatase [Carnobacterium iners]